MPKIKTNKLNKNKPVQLSSDQAGNIAALVKEAKRLGIQNFLFLYSPAPRITAVHIQECTVAMAIESLIEGFRQVIKGELERNPGNLIMEGLLIHFEELIQETNKKFNTLNAGKNGMQGN